MSPLDETRIRDFLYNYLGETAGERLFWAMTGGGDVRDLWDTWQRAGGTWEAFWTAEGALKGTWSWLSSEYRLWTSLPP